MFREVSVHQNEILFRTGKGTSQGLTVDQALKQGLLDNVQQLLVILALFTKPLYRLRHAITLALCRRILDKTRVGRSPGER
jgi:hypothetical protein